MTNKLLAETTLWKTYALSDRISRDDTHIFKIDVTKNFHKIKKELNDILSDFELEKANRIFNINDKERYLSSKYYLRKILANFINILASQVDFIIHEHKKPTVKGIEFNISHTGNYVLIIVSPHVVGIDIETIDHNFEFESILNITFSKKEIQFIGEPIVDAIKFYTLWTRKEAILKAGGEGTSNSLHLINCLDDQIERKNIIYQLRSFFIDTNYIASTAISLQSMHINYWEVV